VTGELTKVLLFAAVLAFPLSLAILWLYRSRVTRAMHRRAQPGGGVADPLPAPEPPPTGSLTITHADQAAATPAPSADQLFTTLRQQPAHAAAIYAVAGLCYAGIMAAAALRAMTGRLGPISWLQLTWTLAWPAVLVVIMVAASSPPRRVRVVAVYFAVLLVLNGVALAKSPDLTALQLAVGWLAVNLPPSLLLALFLARPIRAVGPLVLAFLVVALAGVEGAVALAGRPGLLGGISEVAAALHLNASLLFVGILAAGFAALAPLGWLANRWLASGYARKRISDQSVTVDALWLVCGVEQAIVLFAGEASVWLAAFPVALAVYKAVTRIGFGALTRRESAQAPRLLLLRSFSLGSRSERLFDAVTLHWRHAGSVQLIAGPDLATTTIEPHEFLDFLRGRLARRFIDGPVAMDRRFAEMDLAPDHDGRFRVNEFFCYDDTWRAVLQRLAAVSDVAVMDLRGFSRRHTGLAFEIQALIHTVELPRILVLVDASTDEAYLAEIARDAWRTLPADSPNRASASPTLRLFAAAGAHRAPLPLLRAIAAAARPATAAA